MKVELELELEHRGASAGVSLNPSLPALSAVYMVINLFACCNSGPVIIVFGAASQGSGIRHFDTPGRSPVQSLLPQPNLLTLTLFPTGGADRCQDYGIRPAER